MKPDLVTVGLIALAAYLAYCYFKRPAPPRTFYAAGEMDNVFL